MFCCKFDRSRVPKCGHAANDGCSFILKVAVVSEGLSRVHIGDVQLDEWDVHSQQSIANRDTGMGESARVDDDYVDVTSGLMDTVDDGALPIRLEGIELGPEIRALLLRGFDDVVEGRTAVQLRLSRAEQIEVWAVDEEDAANHCAVDAPVWPVEVDACFGS